MVTVIRQRLQRTGSTVEAAHLEYAIDIIVAICRLAAPLSMIDDLQAQFRDQGILEAVANHDTATLFDWLAAGLSFQGIADRIAYEYMERHGRATWADIEAGLAMPPSCPKLKSYWHFHGCRYHKGSGTCAEPDHLAACPLPTHDLRNGHLNRMAYSLFLFIRDVAGGDVVGWIDARLAAADEPDAPDRLKRLRQALLDPLRCVHGVSDKVLSVALADLLLIAGTGRPRWQEVGGSMIGVDTLVHNFLHRTGILNRFGAGHRYGSGCYQPHGCAEILEALARHIDARTFNPAFPATFPRFVQLAVWRYCAQSGLNVCNGNRIDDLASCNNVHCRLFGECDRVALNGSVDM